VTTVPCNISFVLARLALAAKVGVSLNRSLSPVRTEGDLRTYIDAPLAVHQSVIPPLREQHVFQLKFGSTLLRDPVAYLQYYLPLPDQWYDRIIHTRHHYEW
jgi:hypothetical protein